MGKSVVYVCGISWSYSLVCSCFPMCFCPVLINESAKHSNLEQTAHSNFHCSLSNELSIPMSKATCRTRSIVEPAGH